MPLMPGIWTSVIRHAAPFSRGEVRNSSADAKVLAASPRDLTKLSFGGDADWLVVVDDRDHQVIGHCDFLFASWRSRSAQGRTTQHRQGRRFKIRLPPIARQANSRATRGCCPPRLMVKREREVPLLREFHAWLVMAPARPDPGNPAAHAHLSERC